MKYFAKYLLVEGEIKEGDKILSNMDGVVTADRKQDGYWQTKEGINVSAYPNGGGKVKLFLCSRSIQVGDKITNSNYQDSYLEVEELPLRPAYKNWYKVIGEISPEATWVKEGDEFDEEDIRNATYKEDMVVDQSGCSAEEWKDFTNRTFPDINGFQICYMIKGPCGHFH